MASQGSTSSGRGKFWLWIGALVLIAFGSGLIAWSYLGPEDQRRERPPTPVRVEAASPYIFANIIEAIGTARANESVVLTAQVADTVKQVHFREGSQVRAGDLLVSLNNAEEIAQVSEAVASYTEAQKQFDRTKPLVDQGTLSQAALDSAQRNLDEARARLNRAQARAGDYVINAPFAGVLGLRDVSPGTLVSPGTQITTLDDISVIKVDFSIPERFLATLSPGQEIITSAAAYPDRTFSGTVTTVGTRIDPVTRAVTVRAEIMNEAGLLRPGMLLTVELISQVRQTLSVPENSLIPVEQMQYVFRVSGETVERIQIEIGRRNNNRVEVLSGLNPGDRVVYSGIVRLQDGAPVNILETTEAPGLPEDLLRFLEGDDQ